MRRLLFILSFIGLLGTFSLQAKEYTIKEIPMVHLQDRTRYVSNPDNILSASAVATMDSILYALEEKTGIQTLVVAVTGIEGGDCFDFAYRLGQEMGVGQKERNNGYPALYRRTLYPVCYRIWIGRSTPRCHLQAYPKPIHGRAFG